MIKNLSSGSYKLKDPENILVSLVVSQYHEELNHNMAEAAIQVLLQNGILEKNIRIQKAPGAWEVPLLCQGELEISDAAIAFAVIIKGDTYHFDMIANETGRALMNISLESKKPLGMEILAVHTYQQAVDRASHNKFNKGIEAANAVLMMLETMGR